MIEFSGILSSCPQPCVCTRELCVFAFQSLGVMADAAEAIATDADVSDIVTTERNSNSFIRHQIWLDM